MKEIVGFETLRDDVVGQEGGFLGIRRLRLQNRRADGSLSEPYLCDFVVRPYGLDAVVVALYHRGADDRVSVLVRTGLRPPLAFGRPASATPIPDRRTYMRLTELVAGIVEPQDRGPEGVRRRAAEEAWEEAGYRVDPDRVVLLGAGAFPSPGAMAEKFWFAAAPVADPAIAAPPEGDGTPMEEGAQTRWLDLDEAILACVAGDIEDVKTELGLRRLKDALGRGELA